MAETFVRQLRSPLNYNLLAAVLVSFLPSNERDAVTGGGGSRCSASLSDRARNTSVLFIMEFDKRRDRSGSVR